MGIWPSASLMTSRQMPASFGVHGPGERTMAFGFFLRASAAVSLSLPHNFAGGAQLTEEMHEVVGEAVVVIDQKEHWSGP